MSSYPFPKVYDKGARYFHDDWKIAGIPRWLQPWTYIPRKWTGIALPMPPRKFCGNAPEEWLDIQSGYPLAPDVVLSEDGRKFLSIHPVHKIGQWSVQKHYLPWLRMRAPLYFSGSWKFLGRRLHFNCGPLFLLVPVGLLALPGWWKLAAVIPAIGVKPDMTPNDFWHWLELSVTWTKIK